MNIVLLVILVANGLISYKGFNDTHFFRKYEFHIGSIRSGEQFRMFSSGFLHVDLMHLVFNMFTLYMFAPYVIEIVGALYFAYLYFGSLIAGNLLTLYFHKDDYYYRAVGASGAVMGIIYSAILLEPNLYMYGFIPGYIFGFAYFAYSVYMMLNPKQNDNIGHAAHLGGAFFGLIYAVALQPERAIENALFLGIMALPLIYMAYMVFVKKKIG